MILNGRPSLKEGVHNSGERLIPGVTHNLAELIRHRSSYVFFRRVIELDRADDYGSRPVRIVDLGCGVGHGCETLAQIPGAQVVGIDLSAESIEYARRHYAGPNVRYQVANLVDYIPTMSEFDYVVSRNAFEHVPNGLELALDTRWRHRLLFDVPYDEPQGRNPHHAISNIREDSFSDFVGAELFYQDLQGTIYDAQHKPPQPNIVVCICSQPELVKVAKSDMCFPVPPWRPEYTLWQRIVGKLKYALKAAW